VIFIGGDPLWFRQVERDLFGLEPNWLCQHAEDGAKAHAMLASGSFNALILDGQIPDVANLWTALEKKIGRAICLVRRNMSDRSGADNWRRTGITTVSDNVDVATLVASLKRADRLRDWMSDPTIKKLLPLMHKLPIAPRLHEQVTEQLQSPNGSLEIVACLISQDPVMSAKILQVANSAFFARSNEVTDTAEAVMVLGAERIKSLILVAGIFSQYGDASCPGFSPEPIWSHSVQVAICARAITFAETKDAPLAEAAFSGGLLHDIGKLILAGNQPKMYEAALRLHETSGISLWEAERTVLGATHAELGACLLGTWGLPLPILEAIAWHHEPERSGDKGFSLLAAVHAANAFTREGAPDSGKNKVGEAVNFTFLLRSGLGDCRNRWREVCGFTPRSDEETAEERIRRRREVKEN
jgi:putative nucleotidyltransferase with HDIG domain